MQHCSSEACLDIPVDVVDLIMRELARKKDLETLKACSLACRSLLPICQKHVFATIKLDFSKQFAPQFRQLVKQNPALAGYVRGLHYIDVFNHISEEGALILRQFHRVNSFRFGFTGFTPYIAKQDWEEMPKSLRTSLCSFIQANNIVELYLSKIKNLPVSLFLHFPALSSLGLSYVRVADSLLPIMFPGQEVVPSLSSLNLGYGSLDTVWKLLGSGKAESRSILDLTQLSDLMVQAETRDAMKITKYILKATENIKTVRLEGDLVLSDHPCPFIDLSFSR